MILTDYRCIECNYKFEVIKDKITDNWPIEVHCPKCDSLHTKRIYFFSDFNVCEGKCGNAKTGYAKSVTYHPSVYGRFKGKKVSKGD